MPDHRKAIYGTLLFLVGIGYLFVGSAFVMDGIGNGADLAGKPEKLDSTPWTSLAVSLLVLSPGIIALAAGIILVGRELMTWARQDLK